MFICNSKINNTKYWNQFKVAIQASMVLGIAGIHYGWVGPTLLILTDPTKSFIKIDDYSKPLLSGLIYIGSMIGPIISPYLSNALGRQKTLLLCTFPNLLSFMLIFFANDVLTLYLARFIGGIPIGVASIVIPIYISEVASPEIRGTLGIVPIIYLIIGNSLEYWIVPFLSIKIHALVCCFLVIAQGVIMALLPDTPYFYIMHNRTNLTKSTLTYLRGTDEINDEYHEVLNGWMIQQKHLESGVFDIFKSKPNRRAFYLCIGLCFGQQFSGLTALNAYRLIILKATDINRVISIDLCGIILTVLTCIFIVISLILIDYMGRKTLLSISFGGSALSLFIIGMYFLLRTLRFPTTPDTSLVPFIFMIIYTFFLSNGVLGMPQIISSELFATKLKAVASSLLLIVSAVSGFAGIVVYDWLAKNFGIEYALWFFAVICAFFTIYPAVFQLPETKGKSLEEIQLEMEC